MQIKRLQVMRALAVFMLFLVSVSAVALFILVALSPLPQLKEQERSLQLTLSGSRTEMGKLALIEERTTAIDTLLSKRKSYQKNLETIESKLPEGVDVTTLRVDESTMVVTVESKSLQLLDTFLSGVIDSVQKKEGFTQVTMNDLAAETIKDTYSMTLKLVLL